jgi:predicted NBD/HSP70 family sugar kinase
MMVLRNAKARAVVTARPTTIREINRSILLNLIRLHEPISRKELSVRTGMFCSNVSAVVDSLIEEGLLLEQQAQPVGRGRVPVNLFLNPEGFRVLGISIRPDRTSVAWAGLQGRILKVVSFATPSRPQSFLRELARATKAGGEIQRIGISVPGLVDSERGTILLTPSLPAYSGYPIAAEAGRALGCPALADNDCNTGVVAELWFHEADVAAVQDSVLLSVSDRGVGAGVLLHGQLYRGHNLSWAGEFGHMVVDRAGPKCRCGRQGCWEVFISNQATWQRYDPRRPFTPERFDELIQRALDREARAVRSFEKTAEYLALGLSNISFALNPESIVIAGAITRVWRLIRRTVESMWNAPGVRPQVRVSRLSLDELYMRGAVVLALEKVFAAPQIGAAAQVFPTVISAKR